MAFSGLRKTLWLCQLLALFLAILSPLQADDVSLSVIFVTEPPGAKVYGLGGAEKRPYLGQAGKPLHVKIPSGRFKTFVFSLEGFENAEVEIKVDHIRDGEGRYPKTGAINLVPLNNWVATKYWLLRNRIVVGFVLGFTLVGGLYARSKVVKSNRQTARAEERERRLAEFESNTDDSLIQKVLGSWKLVEEAGRGGMSVVYKALPNDTLNPEQMVAVKVLSKRALEDEEFMARFRREVLVCRSLNHRNIVQLIDWGEQDDKTYIVMEWLEGETLREHLKGAMDPAKALEYLEPLYQAVAFAHRQGVVHRDLKPGNVMLTSKGLLKVVDFGLARAENTQTITVTGDALGTPAYMAPEQIKGRELGPATDQYALGIVTYEILTGQLPFEGKEPLQLIFSHLTEEPRPPSDHNPQLPKMVDEVILRMLAKETEERYGDLKVALEELRKAIASDD